MIMHMLWTGFVGVRLSQYIFAAPESKPSLLGIFGPVMVIHGLWDWVAFDQIILNGWVKLLIMLFLFAISTSMCFGAVQRGILRQNVRASVVGAEAENVELQQRP